MGYSNNGNINPSFLQSESSGKIWSINHENGDVNSLIDRTNELLGSINKEKFYLSSFGETSEGELLVVDYSGDIYLLKKDNKDY